MKFPYHVYCNDTSYAPFEEVPIDEPIKEPKKVVAETVEEIKIPAVEETKAFKYTKTDVNRMPIGELKSVAKEFGIANAETKNGAELKKELIEKFGL